MITTEKTGYRLTENRDDLIKAHGLKEVELVERYLMETDAQADALAKHIQDDKSGKAMGLFRRANEHGIDTIPNASKVYKDYFQQAQDIPEWVDWEQLERGAVAISKLLLLGPLALTVPLGATYVSHQATILALTGHLTDRAEKRLVESTIFFQKVFKPGNMKPGADGFKAANHIRLIHAFARSHIRKYTDYETRGMGAAINQYDTGCGQIYYFTNIFFDIGMKFGITFSYEERADVYALWRYTCYLMGVPDEVLAKSVEDAENKTALLKKLFKPNDDSRAVLKALVENTDEMDKMLLGKVMPKWVANQAVDGGHYKEIKWATFRSVFGESMADKMGVPKSFAYGRVVNLMQAGVAVGYHSLFKFYVSKLDNVHTIARIGEGLIKEYYDRTNSEIGLIDNASHRN